MFGLTVREFYIIAVIILIAIYIAINIYKRSKK